MGVQRGALVAPREHLTGDTLYTVTKKKGMEDKPDSSSQKLDLSSLKPDLTSNKPELSGTTPDTAVQSSLNSTDNTKSVET